MRIKSKLAAGIAAVGILVAGMFGVAAGQAQPGNDTVCEDYETLWEELEEGELVAIQLMEKHGLEIDMNDHDYEQKRDAAPPELRDRLLHLESLITRAEAAWLCENPPPATGQAQPGQRPRLRGLRNPGAGTGRGRPSSNPADGKARLGNRHG